MSTSASTTTSSRDTWGPRRWSGPAARWSSWRRWRAAEMRRVVFDSYGPPNVLTTVADRDPVPGAGEVLVRTAAGGVGSLLCQLAAGRGATVIGTVSSPQKASVARAAGAAYVIDYAREDFAERVREITGGAGVDVVYDAVGRDTFEAGLSCLRP